MGMMRMQDLSRNADSNPCVASYKLPGKLFCFEHFLYSKLSILYCQSSGLDVLLIPESETHCII